MNWYKKASRTISEHIKDTINADLSHPIFITEDLEIIDGAHRTCKAYILGKPVEAIILNKDEIHNALLPKDSDYVGQIYRDDDKNEHSITKLIELYGNKKPIVMKPKDILKKSEDVWGKEINIYDIIKEAKKILRPKNELV
jgi:hypothetical protein